jgi:hypothetical protein
MNLLTPIAGFLIGYGGIMGYQVIDSTYKGEMPGPKSFGYFIGGMTLLSAATIYALGRTDKVFNAGGLSQFTPNELTQSSAIHGDFDHASLNYSGHQNMILKAERMHGDDRLDRWVENNYGEEYDWVLLDENAVYGDVYEELEDFIVLDDEGSEHKGIAIVYRDEDFDAESEKEELERLRRITANLPNSICRCCGDSKWTGDGIDFMCVFCEEMKECDFCNAESFSAEGNYNDFIEDMEGVIGKYGEMKDFDSGYNPQDNLLKARMVVEVDDDDFDNVEFDAEMMMPEKQCVICGGPYTGYGHNPEPIFPMSRGRCCDVCNATVVIPYRMGGMNFRFGEDFEAQGRDVMGRFVKMDCDLCGGKDEVGYVDGEREFKVCKHCDIDGDDYNPKLWEAETVRKFRNRFDKTSPRGNRRGRAATGVKRNIWKNFFRKDAENMSDELDMVMAQLYEIEDMKNPTPEDLTNYQNLLTRYYEMVRFNAEQKTARVRTMSGKPVSETLRKLKQDKNLSAKDARTRKEIKAENMEVFEAPKTMTPLQAKNKFIALAQPYWIKALTKLKEGYIQEKKDDDKRRGGESEYFQQYDYDIEDTNTYLKIAKSPSKIKNIIGCDEGDTVLREMIPDGFYHLINYPREDYYTWENTMFYFQGPKAIQKQLKALLPIIKGKVTVKPKATKKTTTRKAKPKAKAKTGRKAPTISATRRKIGTRMRGNDGKMWEVKKSGKSQRWMAGAETFEAEVLARDWKWKGIKWTPEEEATLSQEEKEVIAEQLYNDWKEDLNS